MKRKWLVVGASILAMVLLVLGSFSNVIGYQSVQSSGMNDSPLFTVQTQRATNQRQNSITSHYLGKGNLWNIPMGNNRNEQLKKAIEFISKMNEKVFAQFTELCIQKAKRDTNLRDENTNKIIQTLHLLRKNPRIIINSFITRDTQNITSSNMNTICNWQPGCMIFGLYFILVVILAISIVYTEFIIEFLKNLVFPTTASWCRSVQICK
jgi:hypothetical protein